MLRTLLLSSLFAAPAVSLAPVSPTAESIVPAGDEVKALKLWLKLYRGKKLDLVDLDRFRGKPQNPKFFPSVKFGLVPTSRLDRTGRRREGRFNNEKELRLLCDEVAKLGDVEAAKVLLEVAAIGLDGKKHAPEELTGLVRGVGIAALGKMGTLPVHEFLRTTAETLKGAKSRAALRALGLKSDERDWPVFKKAFASKDVSMRIASAKGLRNAKNVNALEMLADHTGRETEPRAIVACLEALTTATEAAGNRDVQRDLRRATSTAITVLGKHGWQVDDAAIAYLERVRSADTVPAMINVLENFDASDGKLSSVAGTVRMRAHELLKSLSGANFPMDDPQGWRSWWERVHDEFKPVEIKSSGSAAKGEGKTSTGTFFGIPVRGSHVLFIVDYSGSMDWPSYEEKGGRQFAKMEVAKRELKGAIDKMAGDGAFGLVWFHTKAGQWKPKLVAATQANKKKFNKYIDGVAAGGGTNLWGGLKLGLGLKTISDKSSRYESWVDEIFVLADGSPSYGDIIEPEQILEAVRDANQTRRVRINTVFVGGPEDEGRNKELGAPAYDMSAAELMKRLAAENGGTFIEPGKK